jgi:hypothetical protein|nr:MAG TPA: hypothetical protein [Crassvirales sp.]
MDDILYEALTKYYHALEVKGYMSKAHSEKLLVMAFYRDFMFNDYRALLSKRDYCLIEKALDCIYGTSCLIPYPDYLKMGKLHLGEMTEMAQRIKNLEETEVIKAIHDLNSVNGNTQSDVLIMAEE